MGGPAHTLPPGPSQPSVLTLPALAGYPVAFNMCEWGVDSPWTWGDAVAQTWRMAGDHTGVWSSTKSTIAASAAIPAQYSGRPYGWVRSRFGDRAVPFIFGSA